MELNNDGSMKGKTFSGDKYKGEYPTPKHGEETYHEFYERVEAAAKAGFHKGDLSWAEYDAWCKGHPYNNNYMQDDVI